MHGGGRRRQRWVSAALSAGAEGGSRVQGGASAPRRQDRQMRSARAGVGVMGGPLPHLRNPKARPRLRESGSGGWRRTGQTLPRRPRLVGRPQPRGSPRVPESPDPALPPSLPGRPFVRRSGRGEGPARLRRGLGRPHVSVLRARSPHPDPSGPGPGPDPGILPARALHNRSRSRPRTQTQAQEPNPPQPGRPGSPRGSPRGRRRPLTRRRGR